jgi:hypothetical protein
VPRAVSFDVGKILHPKSWTFVGLMSVAAVSLPLNVAAESHIQSVVPGTASDTSARVNFKIIIPQVLYFHVRSDDDRSADAETVAVISNSRSVTLAASFPAAADAVRGNVILSSAARKGIAQNAVCGVKAGARGVTAARTEPLVCTASTP